jgi:DNA-binding transcriptional LysR family regulator
LKLDFMMPRADLNDLQAFRAVARERSFTRAAAQLGVSPSALSQALRGLEARLGLRLLTRTTRSVAPTEAGERLLRGLGPAFDQIDAALAAIGEFREKPSGTIRITAGEHAVMRSSGGPWSGSCRTTRTSRSRST